MWTIITRSKLCSGSRGSAGRPSRTLTLSRPLARDSLGQRVVHRGNDVLGEHAPFLADARGEADRVIALAGADIGDGHPRLDRRRWFITSTASLSLSRSSSVDQRGDTIAATGRSAAGKPVTLGSEAFWWAGAEPRPQPASSKHQCQERALASIDVLHLDRLAGHALR